MIDQLNKSLILLNSDEKDYLTVGDLKQLITVLRDLVNQTNSLNPTATSVKADTISEITAGSGTTFTTKVILEKALTILDAVSNNQPVSLGQLTSTLGGYATTPIAESSIAFTDITTNNATTLKHGYLQKLTGSTNTFLRGDGAFATPAGIANSYLAQDFSGTGKTAPIVVTHNFGAHPIVQVMDSTGHLLQFSGGGSKITDIQHDSLNQVTITLSADIDGIVMCSVGSPQLSAYIHVADNYNVTYSDYFVEQTVSGKNVTLPYAVGYSGKIFIIKNTSAGDITVASQGTNNVDGVTSGLLAPNQAIMIIGDGVLTYHLISTF